MASTPVCSIDETGIHKPDFATVLAFLQGAYRTIYGSDVYLGNDAQDGQWVALIATALNDANNLAVSVYNSRSPVTAQGASLSSLVKINGITRAGATYSTADLRIVGQYGAVIENGIAADDAGNQWALPPSFTIPYSGEVIVTGTCTTLGAVSAPPGAINRIATPTFGWQSVTNDIAAVPGLPIETDAALRRRQRLSTTLPALSVLQGTAASVAAISGVSRFRLYENDTDHADADGLPGHSISAVVEGGDAAAIAATIAVRKGPGVGTYGSTVVPVTDNLGITRRIAFYRPTLVPIRYAVTVKGLSGFTVDVQNAIAQAISDWTNALGIGNDLLRTRVFGPALLPDDALAAGTFEIVNILVGRDGNAPTASDIDLAFYEAATCTPEDVAFTVVAA